MSQTPQTERRIVVIHGPNLNLLGRREPDIYGVTTLDQINERLQARAAARNFELTILQSNHEGVLIDAIHEHGWNSAGIIMNPGAFTHYSYTIRDAIAAVSAPLIEVHLSNTATREAFRHHSVVAPVALGSIIGLGPAGYEIALEHLIDLFESEEETA